MLKGIKYFFVLSSLCVFSCGEASTKKIETRGWIGGDYLNASTSFFRIVSDNYFKNGRGVVPGLPSQLKERQNGAVIVNKVYEGTPVLEAGLQEADVIFEAGGKDIKNAKALMKIVDKTAPGATLAVKIYRNGEIIEKNIVVGRETYKKMGHISIGFGFGFKCNILPGPNFNLFSLVSFNKNDRRLELKSKIYDYYEKNAGMDKDSLRAGASNEGWDLWLVFIGCGKNKMVLSQDIVK